MVSKKNQRIICIDRYLSEGRTKGTESHERIEKLARRAMDTDCTREPYSARSAVAVKTLPKGALVEIEVVAS